MKDLELAIEHRPGALAELGEALGAAGVSIEGGGVFALGGIGLAHFLVADRDAAAAATALASAGIRLVRVNDVVLLRLRQEVAGQLGASARRMAEAGIDIQVQYSDHAGNLVLVVDDAQRGREVAARWSAEGGGGHTP